MKKLNLHWSAGLALSLAILSFLAFIYVWSQRPQSPFNIPLSEPHALPTPMPPAAPVEEQVTVPAVVLNEAPQVSALIAEPSEMPPTVARQQP